MSVASTTAKNTMLDALALNEIQLHNGDPGAAGTANRVGGGNGEEAATFASADSAARALNADVEFTGLSAAQPVSWISVWNSTGPVFEWKIELSGDTAANSEGEFTVTTATTVEINDPT